MKNVENVEANLLAFLENEERAETWWIIKKIMLAFMSVEKLLRSNAVLLEWPTCSPDINPIENFWEATVKRLDADNL